MRLGTRPAGSRLTRRTFLKSAAASVLGATALGAGGLGYSREIEPEWVEVAHVPLTLPRLAVEFDGYRIAHLTDIHLDRETAPEYTAEILRLTNAQRPDLVAITGDFVTHDPERFAPPLAGLLRGLEARDGVVAVLGNHDHWTDAATVRRVIEDGGAVLLDNAVRTLRRGAAILHVAGLDDWWSGEPDLDAVLRLLPADGTAVLLVHEPDAADAVAAEQRFDLQLSGHSHGGQVRFPLVGPLRLPPYGSACPRTAGGIPRACTGWRVCVCTRAAGWGWSRRACASTAGPRSPSSASIAMLERNREIAAALFLSEKTVNAHVSAILRKLNAEDRTETVTIGLRRGLISI